MYTCLAGYKVKKYSHEKTFIYPKDLLEPLLTDPITKEWMTDPIIINNHLYDKNSIKKWLRISNIDPLTGEDLTGEVNLIPFNLIKYILYAFEETDNELIFHSPLNSLRFAHSFSKYLPLHSINCSYGNKLSYSVNNTRKSYESKICLEINDNIQHISINSFQYEFKVNEDSTIIFKDCKIENWKFNRTDNLKFINCEIINCYPLDKIEKQCENCTIKNDIYCFSLEEYLFSNIITGSLIDFNNIVVSPTGITLNNTQKQTINSYALNSKEYFIHEHYKSSFNMSSIRTIMNGFKDILNITNLRIIPTISWVNYNLFYCKKVLSLEEDVIKVRSYSETVYNRLQNLKPLINDSMRKGITKLSDMVTSDTIKEMGHTNPLLMQKRDLLGIPFLIDQEGNTYGQDLSLLILDNKTFIGVSLKDFSFSGGSLRGTVFLNCKFMECCFVGTDLRGTKFINCSFSYERQFYKTLIDNNTKFIETTVSTQSYFNELLSSI